MRTRLQRHLATAWRRAVMFFERRHLLIFTTLLGIFFLPFLLLGEDSHVLIHDNLDSMVPWLVVLAREGKMLAYGQAVEQVMNGVPRSSFPSGLNLTSLLFLAFPPFTAYLLNHVIVHGAAFFGMYRLLKKYLIPEGGFVVSGVAFCFAMLPFYTMWGLAIAGYPLLLSAVLGFAARKARPLDLAIVLIFPFYSDLVRAGVFVVAAVGLWFVVDAVRWRRVNAGLLLCVVLLTVGYVTAEWSLIKEVVLEESYTSHRVEFATYAAEDSYGIVKAARKAVRNFVEGQYHAPSLHVWILLITVPVALAAASAKREDRRRSQILALLGLCFLGSAILALQEWSALLPLKERLPFFYVWQIGRFHWFHPLLWFMIFGLALDTIRRSDFGDLGGGRALAALLLLGQIAFVISRNEEVRGTAGTLARRIVGTEDERISYAELYSEKLFGKIARHIGRPQPEYRIVSVGLHPAIAAYNGFYTLDFYLANYPLSYKHQFRGVIAAELEKSGRWRRYYDGWGCRCYVFSSELDDFAIEKTKARPIQHLELGTQALKSLGAEYVFSAVRIGNAADNGLVLDGVFEDDSSPWRIWLYRWDQPVRNAFRRRAI